MCSTGRYTPRRSGVTANSSVEKPKVCDATSIAFPQTEYYFIYHKPKDRDDQDQSIRRKLAEPSDIHSLYAIA